MAELERDMEVDSHAAEPNQWSKPPLRSWELTKLRDTITAVFTQMLEPIRQVVREEILRATNYETREVREGVFVSRLHSHSLTQRSTGKASRSGHCVQSTRT